MRLLILVLSFVGLGSALSLQQPQPQGGNWLKIFIHELFEAEDNVSPRPPPYYENARMARYIMQQSDWTSMATLSTRMPGYPMANVFSVSDGADVDTSSGIPYFYLSKMEISVHDLKADNRASITMSLAQGDYCKKNDLDAEDPRCAHLILTGKIVTLQDGTDEYNFAKDALFNRHPVMPSWPVDHGWSFRKLEIENIMLLDFFGGVKTVELNDYLKATPY